MDNKFIIVNHTKNNKDQSNTNINGLNINYCIDENHIETKCAKISLIYILLIVIQHEILISQKPIDFCIFYPIQFAYLQIYRDCTNF
jgi:hypothetical protein